VSSFSRWLSVTLVFAVPGVVGAAEAATRAERLLPQETLAFVSATDMPKLLARWGGLGFRPALDNPALRAVAERVAEQLPKEWIKPAFAWDELLALGAGEACMAVAASQAGKPVVIFIMDVRGRGEKAGEFFDRLGREPVTTEAPEVESVGGTRAVHHKSLSYFVKDDLLVAATDREITLEMLRSWPGKGALVGSETYRAVMEQCRAGKEEGAPDIRCFIRPVEFLTARIAGQERKPAKSTRRKRPDPVEHFRAVTKKTGFDAIRGVGGVCWLARDRYALLYRVGIYAPDRTTTAMRMLQMPNRASHEPPAWLPKDIAGFASFSWEMRESFDHFAKIFDLAVSDTYGGGEGLLEELFKAIRDDPRGPQVDIRKEVIQRLGQRVLVACSAEEPGASVWDRTVLAFEVSDEAAVARVVEKYMRRTGSTTDNLQVFKVGEHAVYAVTSPEDEEDKESRRTIFMSLAHGYILWGNNGALMKRLLSSGEALAKDPDFRLVQQQLDRLDKGPASFRSFSRYGDDFRILARSMDAENLFTPFFLEAGVPSKKPSPDTRTSAAAAPPTSSLGPAGWLAHTLPNGWDIVGFVLTKPAERGR